MSQMTPAQIRAAIAVNPGLQALAEARDDAEIAKRLSAGRKVPASKMMTRRGVLALLGDVEGARFLRVLRDLETASNTDAVPAWLSAVLSALGRHSSTHALTLYTLGIAYSELCQSPGIDIGDAQTHAMLDIIAAGHAASEPLLVTACQQIKAHSMMDDPITLDAVSDALNQKGN